ncbi:FAD-dependent oxidoreductase [bacterium]|nr:FAD-dependent oxidoreductase [bacterium]
MIIPQKMTARLSKMEQFNDRFWHFWFQLETGQQLERLAGQYVSILLPDGQRRAYSMADEPKTQQFELLIDMLPAGAGVTYLRQLQPGETVEILAPLGQLVVKGRAAQNYLLASGSGISPLRSIVRDQLLTQKNTDEWTLIWSMSHESDFFWRDEWAQLAAGHQNFDYYLLADDATGEGGIQKMFVPEQLALLSPPAESHFYLCGGPVMMAACQKWLTEHGFGPEMVTLEHFQVPKRG